MILSAQSIREFTPPLITPFSEAGKHEATGTSYGLSACGYDVRLDQEVSLAKGDFKLASTLEYFDIPPSLAMLVKDKSTWARRGIAVQNTIAEPGWKGFLTLELTNHGPHTFTLPAGTPIAQVVFYWLDKPTELPYTGKYQHQERGPQQAR